MYPQDTQDTIANQQRQSSVELMPTKQSEEHSQQASENGEHSQQASENGEQASPKTSTPYFKSLALFNGRKTDESVLKLVLRPFPLLLHPAILWGMLTQGALIGWTVMIGVVLGIIVSPSNLSFKLSFGIC